MYATKLIAFACLALVAVNSAIAIPTGTTSDSGTAMDTSTTTGQGHRTEGTQCAQGSQQQKHGGHGTTSAATNTKWNNDHSNNEDNGEVKGDCNGLSTTGEQQEAEDHGMSSGNHNADADNDNGAWYDEHVAWTGECPNDGEDDTTYNDRKILWTDYATNGNLACDGRPADGKYNGGYFVGVDPDFGAEHCGQVVKVKVEGRPDKCAVVIETGALEGGLLLSQRFFQEYEHLDTGVFHADWNFVDQ